MAILDRMSSRNSLGGMPRLCGTLPFSPAEGAMRALIAARRNEPNVSPGIPTGYWNAMNRPMRARSSVSFPSTDSPLNRMSPEVTSYLGCPMSVFANVLLPEPLGPMSACVSPLESSSESPLRISLPSTLTWRFVTIRSRSERVRQRALAGAGGAHERVRLPLGELERESLEDLLALHAHVEVRDDQVSGSHRSRSIRPWPALTRQPRRPHPGWRGARFGLGIRR